MSREDSVRGGAATAQPTPGRAPMRTCPGGAPLGR